MLKGARVRLVINPIGSCFCMWRYVYDLINSLVSCRGNSSLVAALMRILFSSVWKLKGLRVHVSRWVTSSDVV